MSRKSIIFTGVSLYLSLPQYVNITPYLKEYDRIFLYLYDPYTHELDEKLKIREEIQKHFDYYYDLKRLKSYKIYYRMRWLFCIRYKRKIRYYLNKINPKAVITCIDMTMSDRVISQWCKRRKVPFIVLQPSFIDQNAPPHVGFKWISKFIIWNKIFRIPLYRKQLLFGNESSDSHLFLWSNYFIENDKKQNIKITGNPAFDNILRNFSAKRRNFNNILICTQYLDYLFGDKIFSDVNDFYKEAILKYPEKTFYIKIHPREQIKKYKEIFKEEKYSNVKIAKEQNLYELFNFCDLQISVSSFTSFEAVIVGLPIIIINPFNKLRFRDHFKDIDIRVKEPGELLRAIDKIYSEEYWDEFLDKREAYLKKTITYLDGNSGNRVASEVKKLIE